MRYIKIATKMITFTHSYGSTVLLPASSCAITAYPTKVIIEDIITHKIQEFDIALTGPVKNFCLIQDMEKGHVRICGNYREGFALFTIELKDGIHFFAKKAPTCIKGFSHHIQGLFSATSQTTPKLDLGISKKLDLDCIRYRLDVREIVPVLFKLSTLTSTPNPTQKIEIPLLVKLQTAIQCHDKLHLGEILKQIYLAYFSKGLVPRFIDGEYQGIINDMPFMKENPLDILEQLSSLIASMFCTKVDNKLIILPSIPKEFVCGRGLHFQVEDMSVSFLWKSNLLQRLIIENGSDVDIMIESKGIKQYRYRSKFHSTKDSIFLKKGIHYFDRFMK
ncbi:MAG: hypothetical protein HY860_05480 [Chlamydiales bacterium]|nr:hypothetical protein [Chlamydiales bacterium]